MKSGALLLIGMLAFAALLVTGVTLSTHAATPPPAPVNTNAATENIAWDLAPEVTTDGAGNWVAIWETSHNGTRYDVHVARSTDAGATWADPVLLTADAPPDSGAWRDPYVATDGAGTWLAVWS